MLHRGTGNTLPYSCSTNETQLAVSQITAQVLAANASDTTPGRLWGLAKSMADICQETNKDIGALIGTSFTARDLMSVVDGLGEDGLLRYIGEQE